MIQSITTETENEADFALLKGLAQRLALQTTERYVDPERWSSDQEMSFQSLFGSWEGDESGDKTVSHP